MGTTRRQPGATMRFRKMKCGGSVHDIADRSRAAVLDFLTGAATGWGAVELELWLGAPYEGDVEASVLQACERLHEMLASCTDGPQPEFVTKAIEHGLVDGVTDGNGAIGYVPANLDDMDLLERLASLLAADYLTRPNDFRGLTVCEDCGALSFDSRPCDRHAEHAPHESGVVQRDRGTSSYVAIFPRAL